MIRFHKVKIQGFKSFTGEQELDLDSLPTPGFYFVSGRNEVEPELGANGAGKSSLFESIVWALYGKTSSGLKATNVGSWNRKGTRVEVVFSVGDRRYELCRTWSPNSLSLNGTEVVQEEVDRVLCLDYWAFLYGVFIGQFGAKFFDLTPTEKLQVFTQLLQLDRWLEYSDRAKVRSRELDQLLRQLEQQVAREEGKLAQLDPSHYQSLVQEWEERRKEELLQVDQKLQDLRKRRDELMEEKAGLVNRVAELESSITHALTAKGQVEEELERISSQIQSHRLRQRELSVRVGQVEEEKRRLEDLKGQQCPMCRQKVAVKHVQQHVKELDRQIQALRTEAHKVAVDVERLELRREELERGLRDREQEIQTLDREEREVQSTIKDLEWRERSLVKEEERLLREKERLLGEENPYLSLLRQCEREREECERRLEELRQEEQRLQSQLSLYRYWEKGFKEIRLMVVEELLGEFELYVNNNLHCLGMEDWTVRLAVNQETRSGTLRKGFTVLVHPPEYHPGAGTKGGVPFECWSGGEGQRLRLAGTMALVDLIGTRSPSGGTDVEIYDEPTTWLSPSGIVDVVQTLRDRAESKGKKVFIIDHRDLQTMGDFTGVIEVVKTDSGSQVQWRPSQ